MTMMMMMMMMMIEKLRKKRGDRWVFTIGTMAVLEFTFWSLNGTVD